MTPAEYAKSQGWTRDTIILPPLSVVPFIVDELQAYGIKGRFQHPQLGEIETIKTDTPYGYKRIGRVLRPEGK